MNRTTEQEPRWKRCAGVAGIIVFYGLGYGALGYLSQTGFLDIVASARSNDPVYQDQCYARASTPVSAAEYSRNTRRGWWIGCAVGMLLGVGAAVKVNRNEDCQQQPPQGD